MPGAAGALGGPELSRQRRVHLPEQLGTAAVQVVATVGRPMFDASYNLVCLFQAFYEQVARPRPCDMMVLGYQDSG